MKTRSEKNQYMAFALCQISAKSNEDRYCCNPTHEAQGVDEMASFGIFDGHLGAATADALSSGMHSIVAKYYRQSLLATTSFDSVRKQSASASYRRLPLCASASSLDGYGSSGGAGSGAEKNIINLPPPSALLSSPHSAETSHCVHGFNRMRSTESAVGIPVSRASQIVVSIGEDDHLSTRRNSDDDDDEEDATTIPRTPMASARGRSFRGRADSNSSIVHRSGNSSPTAQTLSPTSVNLLPVSRECSFRITESSSSTLKASVKRDALMCEAIRRGIHDVNEEMRKITSSGATAISVFLQWLPEEEKDPKDGDVIPAKTSLDASKGPPAGKVRGAVRVYCANVGDSRCIMLRSNYLTPKETPLVTSRVSDILPEPPKTTTAVMPPAPPSHRLTVVHMMSEDHKLTLHRERQRILTKSAVPWHLLPADATPVYLPESLRRATGKPPSLDAWQNMASGGNTPSRATSATSMASQPGDGAAGGSIFDWNYPTMEVQESAKSFLNKLASMNRLNGKSLIHASSSLESMLGLDGVLENHDQTVPDSVLGNTSHSAMRSHNYADARANANGSGNAAAGVSSRKIVARDDDWDRRDGTFSTVGAATAIDQKLKLIAEKEKIATGIEPPIVFQESFIKRRTNKDGSIVGPEALYGRHNISIMMTRSVGDRYGPRSCAAVPEISAYTVYPDNHARFILASDGFWDVVSVEDVRRIGLSSSFKEPQELANHLATKALRRRERARMRGDDITCIVIDVNPSAFVAVDSGVEDDMVVKKDTGCNCTIS